MRVAVLGGAGGIGQPLALLLKNQLPSGSTLVLYDVVPLVKGVGVDLSHIPTEVKIEAFQGVMKQPDNAELDKALTGCDVVVIPAGVPRKPGMTRDDLFNINAGIVKGLVVSVAKNCPKAALLIITNPVNSTVPIAAEVLKAKSVFDKNKLFGVSTLDIVRAQTFLGEILKKNPQSIKVDVIGGHSADTMLTVLSGVEGASLSQDQQEKLVKQIANAGTAVVEAKEGGGSATLSMAMAGARFTMSVVRAMQGEQGIVECAYVAVDNMDTQFFALPVQLGKQGVEKVFPVPKLNDYESGLMKSLIPTLQKNIQNGVDFVKNSKL